jgi:HlyD family secretion protein
LKRPTAILVAAAVLGLAWAGYRYASRPAPSSGEIAASGTLNAVSAVQVGTPVSGEIKEISVDFNSPVKPGQVLARIDPTAFEQRVNQARADLLAARGKGGDSRRREALLKQAEDDLERTVIRSPIEGTVILRNVAPGQTVIAAPQAPALFSIAPDLREMHLEAAVSAAEAARLRVGAPARFSVEAFPRRVFSGEVRQVRK